MSEYTFELPDDIEPTGFFRENGKWKVRYIAAAPIENLLSLRGESVVVHSTAKLELISHDRIQWNGITCHLSESQAIAMRSILAGDGSFATLGGLIYGDEFADKKNFYNLASGLRKKFDAAGIPFSVRPKNQRLVLVELGQV